MQKNYGTLAALTAVILVSFVLCMIGVAFKPAPAPPDRCYRLAKIGMTTEVWKVVDNGDSYIIVINEQKGSVAITQGK